MFDFINWHFNEPMSGRVKLPIDMRSGEQDIPWTADIEALKGISESHIPRQFPSNVRRIN